MTFRFIRDHREDFPVRLMCRVLDVSSSGFYHWLHRPESPRAAENRVLVEKIQAIHPNPPSSAAGPTAAPGCMPASRTRATGSAAIGWPG
jgi:putative transposase